MSEKLVREYFVLILVALLCISLCTMFPPVCKAAPVWSDNFDDGNYDGWTVLNGTFTAADHTLRSIGGGGLIVHTSSVTVGTWSFDIMGVNDTDVGFMSTYPLPITTMICLELGQYHSRGNVMELNSYSGGWSTLGTYNFGVTTGWQHINITRDSDGRIYLYHNGTLIMNGVSSVTGSGYFWVCFSLSSQLTIGNTEGAIDNIVVSDTIDIQPPPVPFYRQTWFIPAVFGAVVVALAIVALLVRRRSHA
jgi:hypothetical protein